MTTKVTITTHDWPVEITTIDKMANGAIGGHVATVPPRSARDFYLTSSRSFSMIELPKPAEVEQAPVV